MAIFNRITLLLLLFILTSSPVLATSSFSESLISEDFESQIPLTDNFQKSGIAEEHSVITISAFDEVGLFDDDGDLVSHANFTKTLVNNGDTVTMILNITLAE